jgi:hypothetical protein
MDTLHSCAGSDTRAVMTCITCPPTIMNVVPCSSVAVVSHWKRDESVLRLPSRRFVIPEQFVSEAATTRQLSPRMPRTAESPRGRFLRRRAKCLCSDDKKAPRSAGCRMVEPDFVGRAKPAEFALEHERHASHARYREPAFARPGRTSDFVNRLAHWHRAVALVAVPELVSKTARQHLRHKEERCGIHCPHLQSDC